MLLKNPAKVEVTPVSSTVDTIQQSLYYVEKQNKKLLLAHLLADPTIESVLVFTKTKHGADRIARDLAEKGQRLKLSMAVNHKMNDRKLCIVSN